MTPLPTNRQSNRAAGQNRKDAGMSLAASRRQLAIWRGQLSLLEAIRRSPDRQASTDDTVDDLGAEWADGGRWRGSIPKPLAKAGLIRKAGVVESSRASRHRGLLTQWQGIDDLAIDRHKQHLRAVIAQAEAEMPPSAKQPELFTDDEPRTSHDQKPLGETLTDAIAAVLERLLDAQPKPPDENGGPQ